MKVWITKYALTAGIQEAQADLCEGFSGMIEVRGAHYPTYFYGKGRDWHDNRASAIGRALDMKRAKISALEKQIAKIKKLEF